MRRGLLLVGLLWARAALAHPHGAAETQADMNAAAQADLNVLQARMDSVLALVEKRGTGHPKALRQFHASQAAWAAYRTATIDATYPRSRDEASVTLMCRAWMAERLIEQRIDTLLELLHPAEGDVCRSPWPW